ncbi:MAG TPA: AMP-binding protein, partial [Actinoplanes sp.]|nr:AMP-binding protein [Actinoplanes sp.]
DHGLEAGDRVIVQLPNVAEFVVVCFALFRLGVRPVFALLSHRATEIRHLREVSGAVGYVVAADNLDLAGEVYDGALQVFVHGEHPGLPETYSSLAGVDGEPGPWPVIDPADVAFFLLSGGTTALPKLIPRTHDDYGYQTRATAELLGLTQQDAYLAVLPIEFNFAWGCPGVIGTLRTGGRVVLAESAVADDCFALIEREQITFTSVVPTIAQLWLDEADDQPYDLSSLRVVQVGGAPLHREVAERIQPAFGCTLQQVFGMAEGLLSMTGLDDPPDVVIGTQGRPLSPGDEIRIVDDTDAEVADGDPGELLTRGPYTLRGYYRAPEHNQRAFTHDGFYRTGDVARITASGRLVIDGRLKDVIIKGGNKVSAAEVEGHLLNHPAVARVAVVPMPDRYLGERICAYVEAVGEPPDLATLREFLRDRRIAEFKLPDRVEVISVLPLTGLGKVDKKVLAADAAGRALTA